MDKTKAREHWFFIIPTDDGDRYFYEVFAKWELYSIETNSESANTQLEVLWEEYCKENNLDG